MTSELIKNLAHSVIEEFDKYSKEDGLIKMVIFVFDDFKPCFKHLEISNPYMRLPSRAAVCYVPFKGESSFIVPINLIYHYFPPSAAYCFSMEIKKDIDKKFGKYGVVEDWCGCSFKIPESLITFCFYESVKVNTISEIRKVKIYDKSITDVFKY